MNAAAVIDLRSARPNRLLARLHNEDGLGLIELLIALLVLNVGIFATIGAFTAAATTLRRASHISTAAAIADQEMEKLHNTAYSSIANTTIDPWPNSPDGRKYKVVVSVDASTGAAYSGSRSAVELVTVTVSDDVDSKAVAKSQSTFSRCTQSGLGSAPDPASTACQS
ncbi:MAG TPA: hypothetical protein VFM43_02460 [Gaiellaceae bacterium]|nr:hypothetical protein [Gaiellaceae bacterium]